ncbi:MAG: tetratricopeptide repeat protein [Treponemataceae bacterium]|nr:tetratricopeptide repeat protein [Treponemataceae bacterium]
MTKKVYAILFLAVLAAGTLSAQAQRADALALYRSGNYAQAGETCRQEISENPNNLDSYVVLVWSLLADRKYSDADMWADRGRAVAKYDPRLVESQGEAKFYLGQNNAALALFQEYVSLVTASGSRLGEVYYYMGEIYIRQTKYNHADIAFSTACTFEPQRDYWWTRLGYAKEMAQDYRGAATAYEKALSINPQRTEAKNGQTRVTARLQ